MSKLPDCVRGSEIHFLVEEFLSDHPDGTIHGFGRWLIDKEYEIRKFTTEDVDTTGWPEDITDFVMDYWTGKLR